MFKLIILGQIGANRYQNIILEILLLSPLQSSTVFSTHFGTVEKKANFNAVMLEEMMVKILQYAGTPVLMKELRYFLIRIFKRSR